MVQTIKWKSEASVTNGYLRDDYPKWISDFIKCEELIDKKAGLKKKRERVEAEARALVDIKKDFLKLYKK